MAFKSIEKKRAYDRAYLEKNKEKIKRQRKEYYQKNRDAIIDKSTRYHLEHQEWRRKYYQGYHAKVRLETLAKVDPALKCAMCGCTDTRFLEVNHIDGGGRKEQSKLRNEHQNMILLIHHGRRGLEDLNLLCRACNSIDHLERVFGHTGLRVVWDKQVTK